MEDRTRDRTLFMRSLEKHLGRKVGALWRLEWEERKSGKRLGCLTAHLHLIVFNVRFIEKDVIRACWRRVLHAVGPLMTWIDGIDSGRKKARYVSKYCSKLPDSSVLDNASYLDSVGRHWGVMRRGLVPFANRWHMPYLSEDEVRLCDNLGGMTFRYFVRGACNGFTCFGANAAKVGEILFSNMLDKEGELA